MGACARRRDGRGGVACEVPDSLGHPRCKYRECDDGADEKSSDSRHDAVEVAPPIGFLERLVDNGAELMIEVLL